MTTLSISIKPFQLALANAFIIPWSDGPLKLFLRLQSMLITLSKACKPGFITATIQYHFWHIL